ncbi:hypothetical protein ASPZODRAFT_138751 [Penicilliopsis zonata CBS 506.65]|uniref:Sigma-70 region 2 family protein n=1 Tax=Penicilliopsis zonata CBS 506.65 TaxID=1073090 RepID=A0A1L9SX18_9EURO|nr:hypothetical protein ASPZODRAFT_138751 [Penicilliopsis zonata CBS 506.65]OJJ51677.1 hypothetical protein ASPZODRAFT_138751 [Penicilliopsis zonata CBS 506.65]
MPNTPKKDPPPEPAAERRWQFIDSSKNPRSNLTQVKRHVMQEYIRQKRSDSQSDAADDNPPPLPVRKPRRPRRRKNGENNTSLEGGREGNTLSMIKETEGAMVLLVETWNQQLSPQTTLSAARTDPFNTLPLELDARSQELFDFYVNVMPACSYGAHFRSPRAHNWYTAVFVPEGMKGPVAFQNTVLVHAANTQAWVRNETETTDTLIHRGRAIQMLREHRACHPHDTSDEAIVASLSAAALEDFDPRPGHKEISWVHMRAAREMIRNRGGPAAFANTRLGMLINWQDYILSGYETYGPSFHYEHVPLASASPSTSTQTSALHSIPSPPSSMSPSTPESPSAKVQLIYTSPYDEIYSQCEEFLYFLQRVEQLARHQTRHLETATGPLRRTAFQTTAPLYEILASPPGQRFTSSGDRKQFIARLTALIILNAALWDYRASVRRTEYFLSTLEQAVLHSEVNESSSVEALLQILLECQDGKYDHHHWRHESDGDGDDDADDDDVDFSQYPPGSRTAYGRPWFAGRMLKIAKRLKLPLWLRVAESLFDWLTLSVDGESIDADELRGEILSAPMTCYNVL